MNEEPSTSESATSERDRPVQPPERLDPPWRPDNPAHQRDGDEAIALFWASLVVIPLVAVAARYAHLREGLVLTWFLGCVAAALSFWSTVRLKRGMEDSPVFMPYVMMLVFSAFLSFMYGGALVFLVIDKVVSWIR